MNGQVFVLCTEERADLEALATIRQQSAFTTALRDALKTCAATIDALPDPPVWPTRGYDRETTLGLLADLMPDRSEAEIERALD